MTKSYPKIFLSYAAGDSNIADRLYNDLKNIGILLVRDVLEVAYKQSFKVFMDSITTCDYCIVLVSDNYLKSENCMYEALKMMEDDQFQDKILPILIQKEDQAFYETGTHIVDTKLSRMEGRYAYFQFWSEQYKQTNNKLKSIENQISLSESQNHIEMLNLICLKIEPFLEVIQDLKASSFSELVEANYQPLLNQLGIKDNILLSNLFGIQKIKSFSDQQLAFDDFLGKYGNEHSEFYFFKGYEWQNKGEIDVAKTYYEKTLKLNPSYVAALNNLGLIYKSKENNHKQAEAHFLKSIEANPNYINGFINLGNLYSDTNSPLNNPEKANHYYSYCLTYLQKYVESHPEDEEAKKRLLNIFFRFPSQDITKMKQFWYKIIGTNEELKNKVTEFYDQFQVQGIEQEKERLIDIIRKNPMNADAHFELGYILDYDFGEYSEARKYYKKAIKLKPNHEEAHYRLAILNECKFDRMHLAIKHYEKVLSINKLHPQSNNNLAMLLLKKSQSNMQQIIRYFETAIENKQDYGEAHFNLGVIYHLEKYKQCNYEKAKEHYIKSIEFNPNHYPSYFNLSSVYLKGFNDDKNARKYRELGYLIVKKNERSVPNLNKVNSVQKDVNAESINLDLLADIFNQYKEDLINKANDKNQ